MKFRISILSSVIIILSIFFFITPAAAEKNNRINTEDIIKNLDRIERELKQENVNLDILQQQLDILPDHRSWAAQCVQQRNSEIKELNENIQALGEYVKGESADVTDKRNSLKKNLTDNEKLNATCKLILLRSDETVARINKIKQSVLAEKYFFKGPSFAKLAKENWENPGVWLSASKQFILKNSGLEKISMGGFTVLTLLTLMAMIAGLYTRKRLGLWLEAHPLSDDRSSYLFTALSQTVTRYAPYFLPSLVAAIFFYVISNEIHPTPFISIVAYGLPIVSILLALIHVFLYSTLEFKLIKGELVSKARKLGHRLKTLVVVIFLGYLLFSTILVQSLPESALLLTRGIYGAIIITNLIMVIWLIGRFNTARSNQLFRMVIILLLFAALIAELYGYRNFSVYILRTVLGTLIIIDVYKLLDLLTTDAIDNLESGTGRLPQKLHQSMGLHAGQKIPGAIWIRIIINLSLWAALIASLLVLWNVPNTYIQTLTAYVTTGFKIGSVEVLPIRILQAIIALPLLLTINAWFRRGLEKRWLTKTQMERGARESMATITGYVGVSIAIIISLSIAGMDFSNLALIAGALSVGIGFGLQNIVNNFVSGLILLFERPIKTGDWIQVGTVEGYVRKISIRSTQIQTFDRSDVIVPNSDLISGTVTNWMLYDQLGRVRVPVGVAYGSDTELVKELLLQVAKEHGQVINNPMLAPLPVALFLGFGDSSLNFELRCHISNIDTRLTTISEINFAIDNLFRQNGIEIPFPQRDLHLRDLPEEDKPADSIFKKHDTDTGSKDGDPDQ